MSGRPSRLSLERESAFDIDADDFLDFLGDDHSESEGSNRSSRSSRLSSPARHSAGSKPATMSAAMRKSRLSAAQRSRMRGVGPMRWSQMRRMSLAQQLKQTQPPSHDPLAQATDFLTGLSGRELRDGVARC